MNIVFLCRLYYPHVGGVEKHVLGISEILKKNHHITIVTEQYDSGLKTDEVVDGIQVLRIPVAGVGERQKKWVIWRWIWQHRQLFGQADFIHAHDVVYWTYPIKLIHPHKKIFATFHGWEGLYPIPFKNILKKRLDAWLCAGTICVGDYISRWYGIKPTLVTYGAVDLPSSSQTPYPKPTTLLYLGRLDSDSCLDYCLKLYYRLKPKLGWKLEIIGDGPQKKLLPPNDSIFHGFVPDPEKYIAKATFIFTTGYLGILESFLAGKIVLSHFENPVQKDYLLSHPMSRYLVFEDSLPHKLAPEPHIWAMAQSWAKLAELYLKLWQK